MNLRLPARGSRAAELLPLSGGTVSVAVTLLGLLILGFTAHALVPAATQQFRTAVAQALLVDPVNISPKPKDKFTYICLVVLCPPLIAAAVSLARRITEPARRPAPGVLYAGLVCVILIVLTDPYWAPMAPAVATSWVVWVVALVGAALLVASGNSWARLGCELVFWGIAALSVLVAAAWRWFAVNTVLDTPEFWGHFDAVAYSLVQIADGGTCLVDVVPQYGCYGEVLAPILRWVGVSTLSVTVTFAVAQIAAVACLVWATSQLVTDRFLAACCLAWIIMVTNRIWNPAHDPDFQNMPVRILFPALSLVLAVHWLDRQSLLRACGMGVIAGLALVWNLDTGVTVVGAFGLLIALAGCTASNWRWRPDVTRAKTFGIYCVGVGVTLFGAFLYLGIKAHAWPDLASYLVFQGTFFGAGAFMLPMPELPSLWGLWVALAAMCLTWLGLAIGRGPRDKQLEAAAYLSVVAVGLFVYYTGRSHYENLASVSWPFLLLLFTLLDRGWAALARNRASRLAGSVLLLFTFSFGIGAVFLHLPLAITIAEQHGYELSAAAGDSDVAVRARYVRDGSARDERVAILAWNQAALYAESGERAAAGQMSWVETLRVADAQRELAQLLDRPVDELFLGYELCCGGDHNELTSWVRASFPALRRKYSLVSWSPDGALMRLQPRGARADLPLDLFDVRSGPMATWGSDWDERAQRSVTRWNQPVKFPHMWPFRVGPTFEARLRFSISGKQPPYATIITNMGKGPNGFTVELDDTNKARLYVGSGSNFAVSALFDVEPEKDHELVVRSSAGRVTLTFDNTLIEPGEGPPMSISDTAVIVGGYYVPTRNLSGRLISFRVTGDVVE